MVRRLGVASGLIPVAAATALSAVFFSSRWVAVLVALIGLALLGWWFILIDRAVRAWGYAERDDDLLIRHGVMIQRLTVVPYGRMQFVDVRAGPLDRAFGIATVQLHTAAGATAAAIPGLPSEEASRLRDHLAALGEARAAGL